MTLIDYDSEKTTVKLHVPAVTAVNFAAQETLKDALRDAIAQMTLGTSNRTEYGNADLLSVDPPDDVNAQREDKWLVSFRDTVNNKRGSFEIGTADRDQLDPNDRKHAHIGDGLIVDGFVDAVEAVVLSVDGNAIEVQEITLVGRNI
jgi:hypothetical protein